MTQSKMVSVGDAVITRAQSSVLLFYRVGTGLATTGAIDTSGNYSDLRNYTFDRRWSHLFPLGNGLVLFNNVDPGGTMLMGRVQPDGSYHDLKTHTSFGLAHNVVAISDDIVLARYSFGDVTIGRVDTDGSYTIVRSHSGFDPWEFVVSTRDGLVLFYNQSRRTAATIRVQHDGSYQDLKSYRGFDAWTHIISTTNRIVLFYNEFTGAAATGRIDPNGNYADLRNYQFDRSWRYVVPTVDGHVFFFSGITGREALLGRIDADGSYTDGPVINGDFDPWTFIGSVI
jgi:hypothetical protein